MEFFIECLRWLGWGSGHSSAVEEWGDEGWMVDGLGGYEEYV